MEKLNRGWNDVDISALVPADWNYKEADEIKSEKLSNNLKRNGQVENIIVRELDTGFYEVVNGNHRLEAFPVANIQKIHVFNLGKCTDAFARRVAIETNETRFKSNSVRLAELIKELGGEYPRDDLSSTLPYSIDELDAMERLLNFEWPEEESKKEKEKSEGKEKFEGIQIEVTRDKFEEVRDILKTALEPFSSFCKIK